MNIKEYEEYQQHSRIPVRIRLGDVLSFGDQIPKTLVYGYTLERNTFHVYADLDGIHRVIYTPSSGRNVKLILHECAGSFEPWKLSPCKRAYPDRTDLKFAKLMRDKGHDLCFTTYGEEPDPDWSLYGLTYDEI